MPLIASLHFTPDGVSGRRHVLTINISLLTEGASTNFVGEYTHIQLDVWIPGWSKPRQRFPV